MTAAKRMRHPGETSILDYPRSMIPHVRYVFLRRVLVLPFEAAIAIVSIWSGILAVFGVTSSGQVFNQAFPPMLVVTFNLLYVLSGFAILFGLGWGYRNLEACGLILLLMSLAVRAIAIVVMAGTMASTLSTLVTSITFGIATILRIVAVLKHGTIVQINGGTVTVE